MKFTTLKVAALTVALLGMSQFAVADNDDKGDKSRTLTVSQAADKIKGEEGKTKRTAQQMIAKAVELFKEGKISEATAMSALADVLGNNSPEIGNAYSALINAGANKDVVLTAAVTAGVDTGKLGEATGAGGGTGGAGGGTGGTGGGFSGFSSSTGGGGSTTTTPVVCATAPVTPC